MIKLTELEYFLKVAELQNITKAAEELHLSQPSLSRSMKSLEDDLGYRLFERTGRNRIKLNSAGEIVYRYGKTVFGELSRMNEDLIKNDKDKEDVVMFALCAAAALFPGILEPFVETHKPFKVQYSLNKGDIDWDLMIYSDVNETKDRHAIKLLTERYIAVMMKTHPLHAKEQISLQDLNPYSLITLEKGKNLRDNMYAMFDKFNFQPKNLLIVESPRIMMERIVETNGVCLLPEYTWPIRPHLRNHLIARSLDDPKYRRIIYLKVNRNREISKTSEEMAQYFIDHFKEYAEKTAEL
ncbi:MAG: LysR family transcriptional regulator [Solobacterium sp.]|nr:LysR family transcriptional regulator [Solobacterium sp.]